MQDDLKENRRRKIMNPSKIIMETKETSEVKMVKSSHNYS